MPKFLALALALCTVIPASGAQTVSPEQIRPAATRAIVAIQQGTKGFYRFMDCFSCHDHGLPMLTLRMAREHGIPVDEATANQVAVKGLLASPNLASLDRAVQEDMIIDPSEPAGSMIISS